MRVHARIIIYGVEARWRVFVLVEGVWIGCKGQNLVKMGKIRCHFFPYQLISKIRKICVKILFEKKFYFVRFKINFARDSILT